MSLRSLIINVFLSYILLEVLGRGIHVAKLLMRCKRKTPHSGLHFPHTG